MAGRMSVTQQEEGGSTNSISRCFPCCHAGRWSKLGLPAKRGITLLSSSKFLAMLKPVACCPSPSAEPSFWHCGGDEEVQDSWIKQGGHWAKEAEEPPCTWVRWGSEGSQEATSIRLLVSFDVVYKDG